MLKKNIIANYIGRFYSIIIGIVVLPIYLNYLGAESYGMIGFFTMLMSLMMLLDMGLSQVLSRETARLKDKAIGLVELKLTLRSVESIMFLFSIFVFISVFISASWMAENWLQIQVLPFETVTLSIQLIGFILILQWYVSLYSSLVLGFEQQVWLNVYKMIMSTIRFVGGLTLVIYITTDIFYYFLYQGLVGVLELFILKYKVYSNLPSNNVFLKPSLPALKKIAPFALGIAYTSGIWIVYTQLDKLLLSHYIPLNEYGYFTLVVLVSSAIMQFSAPLTQAMLPRMTALLSNGKEKEMLQLYRNGTKYMSVIIFSIVGMISVYSYELLYSWTGDVEASVWASPILLWYTLGNGIFAISAFQYYLQFTHGNLKYHIIFNTYFPLPVLPMVFYAVSNYGALGSGVIWFFVQLLSFLLWTPFIHSKFAKGIHRDWILKDIVPSLLVTMGVLSLFKYIDIDFSTYSRFMTFSSLVGLGMLLIFLNSMTIPRVRNKIKRSIFNQLRGRKNEL